MSVFVAEREPADGDDFSELRSLSVGPEQRELEARNRDGDAPSEHRPDHYSEHRSDLDDRQPPGGSGTP